MDMQRILAAAAPQFVNNLWRKPQLSLRRLNDLKKFAVSAGHQWQDPKSLIPADPRPKRGYEIPGKGHKAVKLKQVRVAKIAELMKAQPKLIAEKNKAVRDKRKDIRESAGLNMFFPNYGVKEVRVAKGDHAGLELAQKRHIARKEKEAKWTALLGTKTETKKKEGKKKKEKEG